jgi:hypothetical protein
MYHGKSQWQWRAAMPMFVAVAAGLMVLAFVQEAQAVPVFARKYQTSCITCHTMYPKLNDTGEAFRRNGYQFPSDEDVLVKEEPVKLGTDRYKDMFPNSIWPSTLPALPPVSVFAIMQNVVHLSPGGQQKTWDMAFPSDIELIGAGTFGSDIGGLWNVGFAPDGTVSVGRVFVQFSNLFAWSPEEDDDGFHLGNRWAVLPPHAMNLRVGKIDPAVLPHVISEELFPLAQFPSMPTNSFTLGQTGFVLFAEQPAIELQGVIQQYWSYAVGIANGGSAVLLPQDDNTFKDVYFRVARKWYGFPLDGVVGSSAQAGGGSAQAGQPDDSVYTTPGLDFWRAVSLETGVFGWFGKANVPNLPFMALNGVPYDPNNPDTFVNNYFQRVGVDARLKYFDLDLYGAAFWAHDPFPGFFQDMITAAGPTDHCGFMIEADYMFKAWILGFVRYEQVWISNPDLAQFSPGISSGEQARIVPGVTFAIRQNLRLSSEVYINTRGVQYITSPSGVQIPNPDHPESTYQWITSLQYAF